MLSRLSIHLHIKIDTNVPYESYWHIFSSMIQQLAKGLEVTTPKIHRLTHAMLGYLVAVYGIFVERLLNIKWNLSRHNITRETVILGEILSYLSNWIEERNEVMKTRN